MATQHKEINETWEEVSAGSCLLESVNDAGIRVHIGADQPAQDSRAYHLLNRDRGLSFSHGGSLPLWARTDQDTAAVIVTTA